MSRVRVLLVDDSIVVRRLVGGLIEDNPELQLVGSAADGRVAVEKALRLRPDVVVLDVEMPNMDGLAALRELRRQNPAPKVLMFSSLTARAGALTLDALALGASDYVTKPTSVGRTLIAPEAAHTELIDKIKALGRAPESAGQPSEPILPPLPRILMQGPRAPSAEVQLLVVASSTGGPNALEELFAALPGDFPVPILVVQHMPPLFTAIFADRLDKRTQFRVREAVHRARPEPGEIWIAPGDFHLAVSRDELGLELLLHRGPPENSCRPAADVLFRSAAAACGSGALGVVLTGMGSDGTRGCECMRNAGGQVLVQDAATSVVWGMPGSVARAGLADEILPLGDLADTVRARVVKGGVPTRALAGRP